MIGVFQFHYSKEKLPHLWTAAVVMSFCAPLTWVSTVIVGFHSNFDAIIHVDVIRAKSYEDSVGV